MSTVLTELTAGVLTLTLNRPDKLNALTGEMYSALERHFREAADDPRTRAVLIRGAGKAFTAGNDLKDFAQWLAEGRDVEEVPVLKLIRFLVDFDKPLIAVVRGPAVGFGTTLLMHCDAVFAAPSAHFSLPFVKLGLVPEFGASLLLPALAGRVRASRWLLSGEPFGPEEAQALGLVSSLTDEATLDSEAAAQAQRLAALPSSALRATKRLINHEEHRTRLRAAIDAEIAGFVAGLASPEHREAVQAFFDKRPADFSAFA